MNEANMTHIRTVNFTVCDQSNVSLNVILMVSPCETTRERVKNQNSHVDRMRPTGGTCAVVSADLQHGVREPHY